MKLAEALAACPAATTTTEDYRLAVIDRSKFAPGAEDYLLQIQPAEADSEGNIYKDGHYIAAPPEDYHQLQGSLDEIAAWLAEGVAMPHGSTLEGEGKEATSPILQYAADSDAWEPYPAFLDTHQTLAMPAEPPAD